MKQQKGGSNLGRWLGAPVRALSRACDSYVQRMSACAGRMPTNAGAVGGRGGYAPGMQAAATFSSRSRRSGDADVDALVRAMSQRQASARRGEGVAAAATVPVRSRSVAVGRIDEAVAAPRQRARACAGRAASPWAADSAPRRAPCAADPSIGRSVTSAHGAAVQRPSYVCMN